MTDPLRRSLTEVEALQVMRRAVNAWRDCQINSAEALARIGDAIEATAEERSRLTPDIACAISAASPARISRNQIASTHHRSVV